MCEIISGSYRYDNVAGMLYNIREEMDGLPYNHYLYDREQSK